MHVRAPVTWVTNPGWVEIITTIELMAPGLVSKGLLINPPEFLILVLRRLLWDFPNSQATQK